MMSSKTELYYLCVIQFLHSLKILCVKKFHVVLAVSLLEFRFLCWWLWTSLSFAMWRHALW